MYKNEIYTRQLDIIPMESLNTTITIIGAGAVGSWTALSLAKMGFLNLKVFDFDTVDTVNLNSQLYRHKDIGKPKVKALADIIYDFTGHNITVGVAKYEGAPLTSDIVISAVDSMEVRKMIFDKNKSIGFVKTLIDPRMGAETALLYVMNMMDDKDLVSYDKTLYTDDKAVSEPCTRKATQYCALSLSGLVCAQVKSVATKNKYSRITQWDIPNGHLQSWSKES